jgi:glyoxylase-like metal-dependent hydrolase (beta-lactamase superfamily II)
MESEILVLDCGSMRPPIGGLRAATLCLALETSAGWTLVDTGFGTQDFAAPSLRMRFWRIVFGLEPRETQAAVHQLRQRGISPDDVRHIILTHLHFDHAGGLRDFPLAQVHLSRRESEAERHPRTFLEHGYLPAHWSHGPHWVLHEPGETTWHGKPAARVLPGAKPEILLVPLPGHTSGHCGVAIETTRGWLFLAGDAASPFHRQGNVSDLPQDRQPLDWMPGAAVRWILGPHVPWLRDLASQNRGAIEIISSHDLQAWRRHNPGRDTS